MTNNPTLRQWHGATALRPEDILLLTPSVQDLPYQTSIVIHVNPKVYCPTLMRSVSAEGANAPSFAIYPVNQS